MLSRLFILNEYLSLLAIPPRLFLGDTDGAKDGCRLAEDGIHFLEGAVGCLGVEEVDDGEDEGVAVKCQFLNS